jgi:hypothetical protein
MKITVTAAVPQPHRRAGGSSPWQQRGEQASMKITVTAAAARAIHKTCSGS